MGLFFIDRSESIIIYQRSNRLFKLRTVQNMETGLDFTQTTIVFSFVEETAKDPAKIRFRPEIVKDEFQLNFGEMLEREWGLEPEEMLFNSKEKIQTAKARKITENAENFTQFNKNNKLVNARYHNSGIEKSLMKVETIFKSPDTVEDVDLFLDSYCFLNCTRFFVLLFILGLALMDYSFRLDTNPSRNDEISTRNKVSLHFQLLSNCAFTMEILLRMFSKQKFFNNPWKIVSLVGTIACWMWLFMDFMVHDENNLFQALTIVKILLALRVIELFELIRNPFEDFITTIPDLGKIFFPLLIFIGFYSILGLILFNGATEHKCRATPQPVQKQWPEVATNLCGSSSFVCQSDSYCGNPYQYGMPYNHTERYEYGNEHGLVSYDNIGSAFLTTYHYVFLSNWTSIKYKFSKYLSPYITTFYFFTLALFLFFIMANLNMITICKAYIEKEKRREKFNPPKTDEEAQQTDVEHSLTPQRRKIFQKLEIVDLVFVFFSAVVIVCDWEGMSKSARQLTGLMDFVLSWICLLLMILKTITLGKKFLSATFILLDWVTILLSIGDLVYCLVSSESLLYPEGELHILLRSLKFFRIIKVLYFSKDWFQYEKNILGIFAKTINTMKFFFILLFCIMLIFAFMGMNLFAFRVRFDPATREIDIANGRPYVSNYESVYKSLVSLMLMLENERWTETMYNYYQAVGWEAVVFYTVVVFIIHLMLCRLFIAIFLCYFRRNLDKESPQEGESNIAEVRLQQQIDRKEVVSEFLQDREQPNINSETDFRSKSKDDSKVFWLVKRNSCILQILRALYYSEIFKKVMSAMLALHCLTIVLRTNSDSPRKTEIIDVIEMIPLCFYIFQFVIGVVGQGFFFGDKSYLKQSKLNYLNVLVVFFTIVSTFRQIGELQTRIIRRFAIVRIFTPFSHVNKQTEIILRSISEISKSFMRILLMYMFLLLLPCLLPLKLQKMELWKCTNYHVFHEQVPITMQACTMAGGDWINDAQSFTNIFESLALMYQMVTAESWTYYIENFTQHQPWDAYFVLNFFFFNTCLLNIFVGLIVETYLGLKDEAYKLNLLRPSQRGWVLIRNSINELVPIPSMKEPDPNSHRIKQVAFDIISQSAYQNFIDILPYFSVIVYSMRYYRADPSYLNTLHSVSIVIIVFYCLDTLMKLQLKWDYFFLDNSKIELAGFIFYTFYASISIAMTLDHDITLTFQFISVLFAILRCKKLIFRYTWSKTLINSVIDVLPKCIRIGIILAVVLFFYVSVGMEVFRHVKPTPKSDGYTNGFNNAFTSLMTLLKIVSNQSWFEQVSAYVRGPTSADICYHINSISEAEAYPHMGCGTKAAYLFFISFHVIMALLILNLLIATMTAAYDENYEKEYKSVNIFQLQDTLKLWQKYDPRGTGVIPYKKFWRLSSEIAILFGISKKKLIKGKQKFMEELDIEICQSIDSSETSVLCYKFHDVIMKFSKIKLTVSKGQTNEQASETLDFEIHPMIEREIKDYIVDAPPLYQNIRLYKNFKSGEMKYFFGLLRKLRAWRIVAKKKDSSVISKLSHIIKVALEKKQKEEIEINQIRDKFMGPF